MVPAAPCPAVPSRVYVVLTAAGSGSRLGHAEPKAYVPLCGMTILEHALRTICSLPGLAGIAITTPVGYEAQTRSILRRCLEGGRGDDEAEETESAGLNPSLAALPASAGDEGRRVAEEFSPLWSVILGGATREESVRAGLQALQQAWIERAPASTGDTERMRPPAPASAEAHVLIHDAARAFTPRALFERVHAPLAQGQALAVVPTLPLDDTVRLVAAPTAESTESASSVAPIPGRPVSPLELAGDTLRRSALRAVQTPQGFRGDVIYTAHGLAPVAPPVESTECVSSVAPTREEPHFQPPACPPSLSVSAPRAATSPPLAPHFAPASLFETAALDDAMLVHKLGIEHYFVPGSRLAFKITHPEDLEYSFFLCSRKLV